ncbi:site-2 protease family protein [candidate division KSB1 bacterium]
MDIKITLITILIFSIIFHEYAHGWMALRSGDPTAKDAGRLTFNPIPHIDMMGTIILPVLLVVSGANVLFGWAKPVPVNPGNFRNPRLDNLKVSAIAPLSNLFLALMITIFTGILLYLSIINRSGLIYAILMWGTRINILLAVFNLLPIYPLDGSHVLEYFIPRQYLVTYKKIQRAGPVILMLLIVSGMTLRINLLFSIIIPPTEAIFDFYQKILIFMGV